ncbi:MAG: tyrosine-type recombinase/integrase [Opitutales bacterium]
MKSGAAEKKTMWERTSVQCLLRNKQSGGYYARFTVSGKQKWIALETDVFSVAKLRLGDKSAEIEKQRGTASHVAAGKATMGEIIDVYLSRTKANTDFRPATVTSRITAVKKLTKTWPDIRSMGPKQITPPAILEWVSRFKTEGTNFVPPGAKRARKGNSSTSVNRAVDTLRRLMDIAIEQGQIHSNPVLVRPPTGRLKKKVQQRKLALPSMSQVDKMLHAMENNGAAGGWGMEAADLCRFLMYSGARIGEVPLVTWGCVDWGRKQVRISGYKTETSDRLLPLFPALEKLLTRIIERRKSAARYAPEGKALLEPTDRILRLSECQKSIDAACQKSGVLRMTHHDFRHLFATVCIESGVDIPTVAGWLGHSDGGVLAMKTYGHLRREHSQAAALKVQFGDTVGSK